MRTWQDSLSAAVWSKVSSRGVGTKAPNRGVLDLTWTFKSTGARCVTVEETSWIALLHRFIRSVKRWSADSARCG